MMTRITWFVAGAAAGAVGASYTRRKVRRVADQLTPVNVARSVTGRARARGRDVVDALREGRAAMRVREAQLRTGRDAEAAGTGLTIGGNGPAQIIVLSDVRQLEELARAATRPARAARVSADHPSVDHHSVDRPSGRLRRRSRR
jgi:voltage-gated potassium channel Kch